MDDTSFERGWPPRFRRCKNFAGELIYGKKFPAWEVFRDPKMCGGIEIWQKIPIWEVCVK